MIGRMWRGRTDADRADGYEAVFRGVVLPELRDVPQPSSAITTRPHSTSPSSSRRMMLRKGDYRTPPGLPR
jgi:hypothetical protein